MSSRSSLGVTVLFERRSRDVKEGERRREDQSIEYKSGNIFDKYEEIDLDDFEVIVDCPKQPKFLYTARKAKRVEDDLRETMPSEIGPDGRSHAVADRQRIAGSLRRRVRAFSDQIRGRKTHSLELGRDGRSPSTDDRHRIVWKPKFVKHDVAKERRPGSRVDLITAAGNEEWPLNRSVMAAGCEYVKAMSKPYWIGDSEEPLRMVSKVEPKVTRIMVDFIHDLHDCMGDWRTWIIVDDRDFMMIPRVMEGAKFYGVPKLFNYLFFVVHGLFRKSPLALEGLFDRESILASMDHLLFLGDFRGMPDLRYPIKIYLQIMDQYGMFVDDPMQYSEIMALSGGQILQPSSTKDAENESAAKTPWNPMLDYLKFIESRHSCDQSIAPRTNTIAIHFSLSFFRDLKMSVYYPLEWIKTIVGVLYSPDGAVFRKQGSMYQKRDQAPAILMNSYSYFQF